MNQKRIVALLLCVLFISTALAGCGRKKTGSSVFNPWGDTASATRQPSSPWSFTTQEPTAAPEAPTAEPAAPTYDAYATGDSFEGRSDIAYVLIYNPDIYDENEYYNDTLSTGYFG